MHTIARFAAVLLAATLPLSAAAQDKATFMTSWYTQEQIRPYTFNLQPFFADRTIAQQAYPSSEPFQAQTRGVKANFHLFADGGDAATMGAGIIIRQQLLALLRAHGEEEVSRTPEQQQAWATRRSARL